MNRKGYTQQAFTLVELIAVVVILGLIAIIVFPSINTVIKNSRQKAYDSQIAEIEKAAKNYFYDHVEELPEQTETASSTVTITKLKDNGYISNEQIDKTKNCIINPKNTDTCLTGSVKVTYSQRQYEYEYVE